MPYFNPLSLGHGMPFYLTDDDFVQGRYKGQWRSDNGFEGEGDEAGRGFYSTACQVVCYLIEDFEKTK